MIDKTDLRIIKTKKVLFDALLQLMKEKTFEEIKVSDICNKALVNRSTFYAHFNDKYELLVAMLEETKLNLLNSLKKNDNNINTKQYFREMCELLLTHIEDKRNVYTEILVNNRNRTSCISHIHPSRHSLRFMYMPQCRIRYLFGKSFRRYTFQTTNHSTFTIIFFCNLRSCSLQMTDGKNRLIRCPLLP